MRNLRITLLAAGALLSPILVTGCGKAYSTVSGTVTYQGQPVNNGAIVFLPKDGRGPSSGGPISSGFYRVERLKPGEKLVQIVGVKKIQFLLSSEEMARASTQAAQRGDATGIIERADYIPADADGNNVMIELKLGEQTQHFSLK